MGGKIGFKWLQLPPSHFLMGDHHEVVQVFYSPHISFEQVLEAFWNGHDPTVKQLLPRTESVIYFYDEEQRQKAELAVVEQQAARRGTVLTQVVEAQVMWPAGPSHHLAHYVGK